MPSLLWNFLRVLGLIARILLCYTYSFHIQFNVDRTLIVVIRCTYPF